MGGWKNVMGWIFVSNIFVSNIIRRLFKLVAGLVPYGGDFLTA